MSRRETDGPFVPPLAWHGINHPGTVRPEAVFESGDGYVHFVPLERVEVLRLFDLPTTNPDDREGVREYVAFIAERRAHRRAGEARAE